MRSLSTSVLTAAMLSFFSLIPHLCGQSVTMALNDPPSNNVMDDIYVGSYSANVLGGGSVQVTCDDFRDESNYDTTTYTVNTFSSLGNTLWGSLMGVAQAAPLYDQAAWLNEQMVTKTGTTQGDYSYAIWAIFQPNAVASWLTSFGDSIACNAVFGAGSWGGGGCKAGTGGLVGNAKSQTYTPGEFANILILTPNGCTPNSCPEQEFFEIVAEGGSAALYLLFAGFVCFTAIWIRSRQTVPVTPAN